MDFTYDDEQQALRDAVRGLLDKQYGDYEVRRRTTATDPGFDEDLWGRLAEMGVLGLPFSEADGGVGAGPVEIGIVCQELGRVLAPEPYLASVVHAGGLVAAVGTAGQKADLLGRLSAGEIVLAAADTSPGGRWASRADGVRASPSSKNSSASVTDIASTSAMFRPPSVYSSTDAWKRLPSHSSHGDSTVAMTPSSV